MNEHVAPRSVERKAKPPRWSHQRELEALRGRQVVLVGPDRNCYVGTLVAADQFTIKVRRGDETMTWFKHSILGYYESAED